MSVSQGRLRLPSPPDDATPSGPKSDILRGWIKTTEDAVLVFEATRVGLVPRVTRRFHEIEKRSIIQSGAIFVFTEEESGIKRWTDPYLWSASRMQGGFLMYREREDESPYDEGTPYRCSAMGPRSDTAEQPPDPDLEYYILGSWNKGKGLKKNGLMKKTTSMTLHGTTYHLISYYYPSDVRSGLLQTPSTMPELASLKVDRNIFRGLSSHGSSSVSGKGRRGRPRRSRNGREGSVKDRGGVPLEIPAEYFEPTPPCESYSPITAASGVDTSASGPTSWFTETPNTALISPSIPHHNIPVNRFTSDMLQAGMHTASYVSSVDGHEFSPPPDWYARQQHGDVHAWDPVLSAAHLVPVPCSTPDPPVALERAVVGIMPYTGYCAGVPYYC